MIYPIKVIDIINQEYISDFDVVRKYETVDGMWGITPIKITDEDIKALKEDNYLYYSDGEYAQIIFYSEK